MTTALQYFMVVVEEKSIAKAARKLYLSPQNLSNYIHRLEEEYGVLFVRRPQFALTSAGRILFHTLCQIHILEKGLDEQLKQLKNTECEYLRFGIHSTRARALIPSLVPALKKRMPDLFLDLRYADMRTLEKWLTQGDIDAFLGIDVRPDAAFLIQRLHREPIYLVASGNLLSALGLSEAEFREKQRFPLEAVGKLPYLLSPPGSRIREKIELFCKGTGIILHEIMRISDFELQLHLAAQDMGACFCPQMLLRKLDWINQSAPEGVRLYALRVEGLNFTSSISLVSHKLAVRTPALDALTEVLQEEFPQKFYQNIHICV